MKDSQGRPLGWQSYAPIFKKFIEETKPKVIIEVGSCYGASAINMAKICQELNSDTKVYCIDTWLGSAEFYLSPSDTRNLYLKDGYPQIYYAFMQNVRDNKVEDIIKPIPLPSSSGHKLVPQADLIYIDASHEYEDVKRDIETYLKKLNIGGIIFGDDYGNPEFPGVKQAVSEILPDHQVYENWFWGYKKTE